MKEKFDRNMPHKNIGEIEVKPKETTGAALVQCLTALERMREELGSDAKIASFDDYEDIDKAPEDRPAKKSR